MQDLSRPEKYFHGTISWLPSNATATRCDYEVKKMQQLYVLLFKDILQFYQICLILVSMTEQMVVLSQSEGILALIRF